MAFPPGFLDELRSRISLADLVGRRVRLVRRGREHSGLCPFHNEKTPSFYVVEDKGFFHCFGCGAHGDAIGFIMRADNLDFIEAVERLAGEAGIAVPQQTPQERDRAQRQKTLLEALAAAAVFYEAQLWGPEGARARDYLTRRGLDEETIRRFRLGWAPGGPADAAAGARDDFPEALLREAGLLRVPDEWRRALRLVPRPGDVPDRRPRRPDHRLRRPHARRRPAEIPEFAGYAGFRKGKNPLRLGGGARQYRARADAGAAVIVVEGYMDVIALHRAGFGGAVAPLGTALTETQLHELWRLAPEPVLCFDGDAAGQRAALRALARALPLLTPGRSLRFAALPAGEDPDSLIRGGAPGAFPQILAAARPLSEMLWQRRTERRRDRHAGAARRSRTPGDGAGRADRRPHRAERIPPIFSRSPVRARKTGPAGARTARVAAPRRAHRRPRRAPRSHRRCRTRPAGRIANSSSASLSRTRR